MNGSHRSFEIGTVKAILEIFLICNKDISLMPKTEWEAKKASLSVRSINLVKRFVGANRSVYSKYNRYKKRWEVDWKSVMVRVKRELLPLMDLLN